MFKQHHFKFNIPKIIWLGVLFATLASPIIHLMRWALTPDGYSYHFFLNQDLADWLYILQSPSNQFLSIHDVEKDVPVWMRPDAHSLLLLPLGIVGQWLSVPSPILLMTLDAIGNFFCAVSTYFFFTVFLNNEKQANVAFYLVYLTSGIAGLIIVVRWIFIGDFSLASSGWGGENHSLSYDLMEGNMVSWSTILFRPYYIIPRAFGLLSISLLYRASQQSNVTKETIISAICIFLATLVHPQSGLIYGAMATGLGLFLIFKKEEPFFRKISPAIWTLGGLFCAAILWKLYQRIPDVDEAATEYLKRVYNADALPLFFAIATLLIPSILIILKKTDEKAFIALLMLVGAIYGIAVSEWIIREYNVSLRVVLIVLAILIFVFALIWKRKWLIQSFRIARVETLLAVWVFICIVIALSPHHDGIKMIKQGATNFGLLTSIVQTALSALSLIYAAPFRLGIIIPLAALCVTMLWQIGKKTRQVVLASIFITSFGSLSLYYTGVIVSNAGRLHHFEKSAMEFLKTLPKTNVLCSSISSQFIIQIAMKKTLVGGVAGVLNLDERYEDIEIILKTSTDSIRDELIKKYQIDYIFIGKSETGIGANVDYLKSYKKIYEQNGIYIFETK